MSTEGNKPELATDTLHLRCKSSDKILWGGAAKAEGLGLSKWVIKTLNNKIEIEKEKSYGWKTGKYSK